MLIHQLAKRLTDRGVHASVLTARAYSLRSAPLPRTETIHGIGIYREDIMPNLWDFIFLPVPGAIRDIPIALKRLSPDIVHIYGSLPNFFTFLVFGVARLLKKRIVVSPIYNPRRVSLATGYKRILLHFFDQVLLPIFLRRCELALALTDEEARCFRCMGVPNVAVVPEAVEPIDVPNDYVQRVLHRFGVAGRKLAISVGRIEKRKGLDLLIRAWAAVEKQIPDSCLMIVGTPVGGLEYLRKIIREQNLASVVLTGTLSDEDLHSLYRSADLVVSSSRFETFVRVALEAWAYHKPYVGFGLGAATSHIVEGTGLLVPPYNVQALSRALSRVLSDPELGSRMGEKGFREYTCKYCWDVLANRMQHVYESVTRPQGWI